MLCIRICPIETIMLIDGNRHFIAAHEIQMALHEYLMLEENRK